MIKTKQKNFLRVDIVANGEKIVFSAYETKGINYLKTEDIISSEKFLTIEELKQLIINLIDDLINNSDNINIIESLQEIQIMITEEDITKILKVYNNDNLDYCCIHKESFIEEYEHIIYGFKARDLEPIYSEQKSFYGKAKEEIQETANGFTTTLISYGSRVAKIDENNNVTVYDTQSKTTLIHIKEWLKQHGKKADTKKQIEKDYMNK